MAKGVLRGAGRGAFLVFYEYALEPTVLSSWDRARFFLDAFGPWKGRFLAEYPRHWKRMVLKGLTCPDVEKKRIVERLAQLDKRLFSARSNAPYDGENSWIWNAEREHGKAPFWAIIAKSGTPQRHVLDGAEVDDRHERWRVESGSRVRRDPDAFANALQLLLLASKRVVIIDPYFRADQDDKTRPLAAFCKLLCGQASVEVHFADEPRGYDPCMRDAARALPKVLPGGMKVTLHCWKERPGGPRLHNRYLLTDVGGVKFGDGIEMGSAGHEDHLSILDESSRLTFWGQYLGDSPAFQSAGPPREFCGAGNGRR
jgi:hypothetical protein